jgi:hypothetical protein
MSKTKKHSRTCRRKRSISSSRRRRMRTKSASRSRSRSRSRKGGSSYPDSAWGYGLKTIGDLSTQIQNSLEISPGQNLGTSQSNAINPIKNINAQNSQPYLNPNLSTHKGGRKRSRSRSKKGGFWGQIIQQAATPLALLGLQQNYKKKSYRK